MINDPNLKCCCYGESLGKYASILIHQLVINRSQDHACGPRSLTSWCLLGGKVEFGKSGQSQVCGVVLAAAGIGDHILHRGPASIQGI